MTAKDKAAINLMIQIALNTASELATNLGISEEDLWKLDFSHGDFEELLEEIGKCRSKYHEQTINNPNSHST